MKFETSDIMGSGDKFDVKIFSPEFIRTKWETLSLDMEEVLKYSEGDTNKKDIYDRLVTGRLIMYGGFLNGQYKGFFTVFVEDIPYSTKRYVRIVHGYIEKGTPMEFLFTWIKKVKEVSETNGFCVSTRTSRNGLGKIYERMGFRKGYTEYYFDPYNTKEPATKKGGKSNDKNKNQTPKT